MTTRRPLATLALLAALAGCGDQANPHPDSDPIDLGKIPASVLEVAKKELPGVDFERAWADEAGGEATYEIRGRNQDGKTREVKVSASGKVLEKE